MPRIKFDGIYRDLKDKLKNDIYPCLSFLPTEHALAKTYNCSRHTVRRAIAELAREGLVQPCQGRGVRVVQKDTAPRLHSTMVDLESFEEAARRNGMQPSTQVVTFEHILCSEQMARESGFVENEELVHLVRVRSLNGRPSTIDHNLYASDAVPGLTYKIAEGSVYRFIEEDLGINIAISRREIMVCKATPQDSELLAMNDYDCVVVVRNQGITAEGILFEYTVSHHHPEFFCFCDVARRSR